MSVNPWIDYLQLPELNEFLAQAGYDPNERITPRAICCDPVYTRLAFVVVQSGGIFWHPQNLIADLSVVLEYWKTHAPDSVKPELNDWDRQLRGRTAQFADKEIVHLYTSSGNAKLIPVAVQKLLEHQRIHPSAVILNEPGEVLGTAQHIRNP